MVDVGMIWEICQTHGLGELDGDLVTPYGWTPTEVPSEPTLTGQAAPQPPRNESRRAEAMPPAVRLEVAELRQELQLSAPQQHPGIKTSDPAWSRSVADIKSALEAENQEASRQRVKDAFDLEDGFILSDSPQRRVIRFEFAADPNVNEGARATLTVGGVDYDVEIVSVFGASVTLSAPPGTPIEPSPKLGVDLSWLLRLQLCRTADLHEGAPGFNTSAALAVVRSQPPAARRLTPVESPGLNMRQNDALTQAVADGVTWLWGPPGTGKTTTVAAVAAELVRRGERVLLTAPTNAAVDVALHAVLARTQRRRLGQFVRLGVPRNPELVAHAGGYVLVDEVAAVRGEPVARRLMEVNLDVQRLRHELAGLKAAQPLTTHQQQRRREVDIELAELSTLMDELRRLMKEVRVEVCRKAGLVAATSHQVFLETLRGMTFDAVILDEASMTTAALAALVAGASTNRVLVAGDFRQLPPVVRASTPEAIAWLRQSPFERAGVPRALERGEWPANLVSLTEQHRMRSSISELVSEAFYPESPLEVSRHVNRRARSRLPKGIDQEVLLLDTSALHARTERRQGLFSRLNLTHAQLAAALVARAEGAELALISPFAPQARLLSALVPPDGGGQTASTVHRFQGSERDLVVYDSVDTGHGLARLHPWFAEGDLSDAGPRLLNVAVSRARESLVFVGDMRALADPRRVSSVQGKFSRMLRAQGSVLPWAELIERDGGVTRLLDEDGGMEILAEDLLAAARVEMRCAHTDQELVRRFLTRPLVMKSLLALDDSVTVWVPPTAAAEPPSWVWPAFHAGVNVRLESPVLSTIVVTDRTVWTTVRLEGGSTALLRTESSDLAVAAWRVLRRDHRFGPGSGRRLEPCGRCGGCLVRHLRRTRYGEKPAYGCLRCD